MRRLVPLALVLLVLTDNPSPACLNDRDTSAATVERLPAVVDVITGRFSRNIPLYYEMRLERVASEIGSNPDDLALYDDAAVAADRLGRYDEAIEWMERKRARLEAMGGQGADLREHWYRYHANVGTHWVHRWIKQGAHRARLDEVRNARDHIAEAVRTKPDAHFGRERFQFRAIEWLIEAPGLVKEESPYGTSKQVLPVYIDTTWKDASPREAVEGLCGLIVLGNARESVDTFFALALALEKLGEPGLAHMARLRCEELIDAGRGSMVPNTPIGEPLKALLGDRGLGYPIEAPNTTASLERRFREGRATAERLHEARSNFLRERLEAGRHPDTDPTFWQGAPAALFALQDEDLAPSAPVVAADYTPPPKSVLYDYRGIPSDLMQHPRLVWGLVFATCSVLAALAGLVILGIRVLGRHRLRKPTVEVHSPESIAV